MHLRAKSGGEEVRANSLAGLRRGELRSRSSGRRGLSQLGERQSEAGAAWTCWPRRRSPDFRPGARNYTWFAGGSGITPVICPQTPDRGAGEPLHLLYGNREASRSFPRPSDASRNGTWAGSRSIISSPRNRGYRIVQRNARPGNAAMIRPAGRASEGRRLIIGHGPEMDRREEAIAKRDPKGPDQS